MTGKPTILICGKNSVCLECLSYIHAHMKGHEIFYVYADRDYKSSKLIIELADSHKIKTFCVKNAKEMTDLYLKLRPTLLISVQFSIILSKKVIEAGKNRLINLHFSPLPLYRGMAPITLAILNGETHFGVTLHLIDDGIDTGAILDQQTFNIATSSNREVYSLCEQAGLDLIKRNLYKFHTANETHTLENLSYEQDDSNATYYTQSDIDYNKTEIDFNRTASQIERFTRAFMFPPSLYPRIHINARTYRVLAAPTIGERSPPHKPGFVLCSDPIIISSRDRFLIFNEVKEEF